MSLQTLRHFYMLYAMTMLDSIKINPSIPSNPIFSCNTAPPSKVAIAGLIAQNIPARSAEILRWAIGCNVKPKQVHTTARIPIMIHCLLPAGRAGVSKRKDAERARTPMVPPCTIPIHRGSPEPWDTFAVTIIAMA